MKKIIIGICLFFVVIFSVEFISYISFKKVVLGDKSTVKELMSYEKYFLAEKYDLKKIQRFFYTEKGNPYKGSIVFLGTWPLWNNEFKNQDTLPYMVYKRTHRTVYRFSHGNFGINNIYSLFADNYIKDNVKNPRYIIYLFEDSDIARIFNYQLDPNITLINKRYKMKNHQLYEINNHFYLLNSLYCVKSLEHFIAALKLRRDLSEYFLVYMDQIMKKVKEDYPVKTPKVVFIDIFSYLDKEKTKKLQEMGYTIISLKGIVFENEDFPSVSANERLAKLLVRKLKL